jgi:quercetin dioxygenase-like cupin family protein
MLQYILHERRIWRHFGGKPSHELTDAAAKRIPETESPANTPPFRTPWKSRFNPNGNRSKGVVVEYGPGGYSPGHTHAKSAFIYATVLEGAIRSQVNDGPVTTYGVGQSFSELPGDRHSVSANASETKPAKLLAVFVVDTSETELTSPLKH